MKKYVWKRNWAKYGLAMAASFLAVLLAGTTVYAGNGSVTYHTHDGNAQEGGGCFRKPVYHVHQGNETEGGKCYETPVYHVHQGNEAECGGCYQTPVLHVHLGEPTEEGGCYAAVYHTHSNSCYAEAGHNDSCVSHIEYHPYDCGSIHDYDGNGHGCDGFRVYECGGHRFLACGKQDTVTGYQHMCGLEEGAVEGYGLSCEKTQESIESYIFSCTKDENDIDYYEKTCGMEEGQEIYHPDIPSHPDDSGSDSGKEETPETIPTPVPTLIPSPTPTAIPLVVPEKTNRSGSSKEGTAPAEKKPQMTEEMIQKTASPEIRYQVETQEVSLPDLATEPEEQVQPVQVTNRRAFFHSPAVKMITITLSMVIFLSGLAAWMFYLWKTVRIFNEDGDGRKRYLGRAIVHLTEDGYYMELTDKLIEKASTNHYLIKTDLFYIGKNSDWEMLVIRDGKKKTVRLQKEIRITI